MIKIKCPDLGVWAGTGQCGCLSFEKYCTDAGIDFKDRKAAELYAQYLQSCTGKVHQCSDEPSKSL